MIEEQEYEKLKKKIDSMGSFQAFHWDKYIITKGGAIEKKFVHLFPHWIYKIKKFDADLEGYDYEVLNIRDCEHNEGGRVCVRIIKQSEESIPNS